VHAPVLDQDARRLRQRVGVAAVELDALARLLVGAWPSTKARAVIISLV